MSRFIHPPKFPLRVLRFFCTEDRIEEVEGDLAELYNEYLEVNGSRYANLYYIWLVIRSFRSFAFKRKITKETKLLWRIPTFLLHNLLMAKRNLLRQKTITVIHVLGLAVGISSFLAIYNIVQFELSFNQRIPEKDRIYRVYTSFDGSYVGQNRGVSVGVGSYLQERGTGLEVVAPFFSFGDPVSLVVPGKEPEPVSRETHTIIADASFFKIIDQYEWLVGSPSQSLKDPFQVVLTDELAEHYFGRDFLTLAPGRLLAFRDSLIVSVSGIVRQKEGNSDFDMNQFISTATIRSSWLKSQFSDYDWESTSSSSQVFVRVFRNFDQSEELLSSLDEYAENQRPVEEGETTYHLQPLSDLHYNAALGIFDSSNRLPAHLPSLTILSFVAIALLLIATFNFVNLETAQSASKMKEVGLRKVLGSSRKSLVGRFLTESILTSFLATLLALPLTSGALILFEEFIPVGVTVGYETLRFWLFLLLVSGLVGILAGVYPAVVVSSFAPIKALKTRFNSQSVHGGAPLVRKVLICFQFIFSQLLVLGTLAIFWQISFMLNKDLGVEKDQIAFFYTPYYESSEREQEMLNELSQDPGIRNVSICKYPPIARGHHSNLVSYISKEGKKSSYDVHIKQGDTSFVQMFGLKMLAGRNVKASNHSREMLINETFAKQLEMQAPIEAIGITLAIDDEKYQVVGVLKDFHFQSMHRQIEPLMYLYDREDSHCIAVKLGGGELKSTIDRMSDYWDALYPKEPLTVRFLDETIDRFYRSEQRTSKLISTATIIAIFISCLGLFGLMSFVITQRAKEMGIRKVLGASAFQIGAIVSRESLILLSISFVLATPIAYYGISQWVNGFAYRAPLSWWLFLLGGSVSVLFALLVIAMKVWKTALSNPAESLRYE